MDPNTTADLDPEQLKQRMTMEMQQQFVQQLIERLRNECFTRCIASPSRELSSRDQTCLSNCVDRYLESMKVVEGAIAEHSNSQ